MKRRHKVFQHPHQALQLWPTDPPHVYVDALGNTVPALLFVLYLRRRVPWKLARPARS